MVTKLSHCTPVGFDFFNFFLNEVVQNFKVFLMRNLKFYQNTTLCHNPKDVDLNFVLLIAKLFAYITFRLLKFRNVKLLLCVRR